jgi:hypothetical protein
VALRFVAEGERPVYFESLTARSTQDGCYRELENRVIFANPSTRPYIFKGLATSQISSSLMEHAEAPVSLGFASKSETRLVARPAYKWRYRAVFLSTGSRPNALEQRCNGLGTGSYCVTFLEGQRKNQE